MEYTSNFFHFLISAVLIVSAIKLTRSIDLRTFDCGKISDKCHICSPGSENVHIECGPHLDIEIYPNNKSFITCPVSNATNYSLFPHLGNFDNFWVTFRFCSLPPKPISDVLKDLGFNNVPVITFTSTQNATSLSKMHLAGLRNVTRFQLDINNALHLNGDVFQDLESLQWLSLKGSEIYLYPDSFKNLNQLTTLEMSGTKLHNFQAGLFKHLPLLKSLLLWHLKNVVNVTVDTFDGLLNLQSLDLHGNKMEGLPPDVFSKLPQLTRVHLSQNNFVALPEGLFAHNSKLTEFRMNDNNYLNLTFPERFFANLTELTDLMLMRCGIEHLPESLLYGSHKIQKLTLENNRLQNISRNLFVDQVNLEELNMKSNLISHIDDEAFHSLRKLKVLNLKNNNLTTISSELFKNLESLENLIMSHNNLIEIQWNAFEYIRKITNIAMSHNKLTLMQGPFIGELTSPFNKLADLKTLDLSYNLISTVFQDWTITLKLDMLNLAHNRLTEIKYTDLISFNSITLNLSYNNITQIHFDGFDQYPEDEITNPEYGRRQIRVNLLNNPINCDCITYYFVLFLNDKKSPIKNILEITDASQLKCSSPKTLSNTSLNHVRLHDMYCPIDYQNSKESKCPNGCDCLKRGQDGHIVVNCSSSDVMLPITLPNWNSIELWLVQNSLRNLSNIFTDKSVMDHLTMLNVSYNNLTEISAENIPSKIEILDLSHNYISYIDNTVVDAIGNISTLKHILLADNPFVCNCDNFHLISFIQSNFKKIDDLEYVTCFDGISISDIAVGQLCEAPSAIIASSLAIAITGIIIGILAALYYKYQHEIKVWCYARNLCLWCVTEKEIDKDKIYDAFVSFSHKDEDFVVNKLLPELEGGPHPFKICIHLRDWMIGEYIAAQIARSVQDSRRTIVVLSPNFLDSVWGTTEFRVAHQSALEEGRARVIIILYGDISVEDIKDQELKLYLTTNTYVKWGDPLFWDKLKYALPHRQYSKQLMPIHVSSKKGFDDKLELIHPSSPSTPPGQNTPPAHQAHTNPLMNHVNSVPNGVKPTNYYNGTITMNGLKVNGNAKHSDV